MEVTPALKDYVEKRVGKVTKYFDQVGEITVLLTVSKGRHIVEVTVPVEGGVLLRGEEATMDMYTSIDLVVEKLERQIHKHKTKLQRRFRGGFKADMVAEGAGPAARAQVWNAKPSGSGTAFSIQNVPIPQTTDVHLQSSAGELSPRSEGTFPISAAHCRPPAPSGP